MEKLMRGKCLVRKGKTSNGEILILTGIFRPTNFDLSEIEDSDEMWVCDINVLGGLRFTEPVGLGVSPEDFLVGSMQLPRDWKTKTNL